MNLIYPPSDDSYLLSEFLENYLKNLKDKNITYLDMGTGSGILAETASKFLKKENIIASDINKEAINFLEKKGFKTVRSNLFSNIREKFNLISFNAPYLPEDLREPKDSKILTTGGKKGEEISVKFLKQAKNHLKKKGKIFLLISSLTPKGKINSFKGKIVARKKLFFEEILILEFSN